MEKMSRNNRAKKPQMQKGQFIQPQINYNVHHGANKGLRILNDKPENKEKKTVAVIVSFCSGGSYDALFTTVEQKAL